MTFSPAKYHLWNKEYPMLCLWAIQKGILFPPKENAEDEDDRKYDLTSKTYILMKRLGQDYRTIMNMDAEERDSLFEMEMKLIREEQKQNNSN